MNEPNVFLRLTFPVDRLSPKQLKRAVALGNRIEAKIADALAKGANPDRLLAKIESYFPGE